MKPCITAIGVANPKYRTSQKKIAEFMVRAHQLEGKSKTRLLALYRATGIQYRYSVLKDYGLQPADYEFYHRDFEQFPGTAARNQLYKKEALPLAIAAIENCLPPNPRIKTISHLITVSCTGLYAPGLDIELVGRLGLSPNTQRTAINYMGCYGAFNALKVAKAICNGVKEARVLVVCTELCSLHFQKNSTPDFMLSNALFGDGAAALIVENQGKTDAFPALELLDEHCTLISEGQGEMSWDVGDHGFEMRLSREVPELIKKYVSEATFELLARHQWQIRDIDFFALHPGGKRILSNIQEALGISTHDIRYPLQILKHYGNMSSPTILFVLNEIWNNLNEQDSGKKVLCAAFGPGLTLESMLLKVC